MEITTGIKVTGLEPNEMVSYKGTLQSGEIFSIIQTVRGFETSKVFFKKPGGETTEVKVLSVKVLRDGGTKLRDGRIYTIKTKRGNFYFPSNSDYLRDKKPYLKATFTEPGNDIKDLEE